MKMWAIVGFVIGLLLCAGSAHAQLTVSTAPPGTSNNQAASTAFVNGQVINPPAVQMAINPYTPSTTIPGNQPFLVEETVTGTCTASSGLNCRYNLIDILSDNAVAGPGNTGSFSSGIGFEIIHNVGGAAMTGNRAASAFNLLINSTTGNTAQGSSYSALTAVGFSTVNDNGTAATKTAARGQISTINAIAHIGPSASDWYVLNGQETDIIAESGSSLYYKVGHLIVQESNDAVQGSGEDSALVIGNQSSAVGWTNGIKFGGALGVWPFTAAAVIETCNPCGTATTFIDMSGATFSTAFLKGPGYTVNGTGQIISGVAGGSSGSLTLNGSTSGSGSLAANSIGALVISGALAIDGTTPTSCTASGAGSASTCAFSGNSNSSSGTALITAGGTGEAATGTLVINFSQTIPGSSVPVCISGYNNVSTAWSTTAVPLQTAVSSTTAVTFAWNNGSGNALVSGDTYRIDYHCFGK